MLILTRKLGESITIGDDIKVSVLGIRGRQVRLGIEAPSNVIVHREEIYVRVQNENRKASGSTGSDLLSMVKMIKGKLTGDRSKTKSSVVGFKDKRRGHKDSKGRRPNDHAV